MVRILDYNGAAAERTTTVAELRSLKQNDRPFAQVTASTPAEAAAAEGAGIEMAVCLAQSVAEVRQGSGRLFLTAAIDFTGAVTADELLKVAFEALAAGADAVISARRLECIELIASEDIPIMGHLGFVPKKSTLYGGVRGIGKTAGEAVELWSKFRQLEDAGAFGVECELIAAKVMEQIQQRTTLVTVSLGSGPVADVQFLFASDICGEGERLPRHARAYADLASMYAEIEKKRSEALTAFRSDVASGGYPLRAETVDIADDESTRFIHALDS